MQCTTTTSMHFGKINQGRIYNSKWWARIVLWNIDTQGYMYSFLKLPTQLDRVVTKALGMFVFIFQVTEYQSWGHVLQVYKTLASALGVFCAFLI